MPTQNPNPNHNALDPESTDGTVHFVPVMVEQSALPRPLAPVPKKQARPRETSHAFSFGLKLAATCIVLLACIGGLSQIGSTVSVYLDVEQSLNNIFKADPLEFSVVFASSSIDIGQGQQLLVPVFTPAADSEPIQYFVEAHTLDGDASLCNELHVLATEPFPYDGLLASLKTATTTDLGSWALTVWLPKEASSTGVSCRIDLVYTGWNANAPWGSGYTDIEHVPLLFYIAAATSTPPTPVPPPVTEGIVEGTSTDQTPPPADATTTPPEATTTPDTPAPSVGGGGWSGGSGPSTDSGSSSGGATPPAEAPAGDTTATSTPDATSTPPSSDSGSSSDSTSTPPVTDPPPPDPTPPPPPAATPPPDPTPPAPPADPPPSTQ